MQLTAPAISCSRRGQSSPLSEYASLSDQTPYFVLSRDILRANYQNFVNAFPKASVYYAIKANSELICLQTLLSAGCGFEAASRFELDILARLSVPPSRIVYGSAIKPASHIREFFGYGVRTFAYDAPSELDKLSTEAPGSNVYLRIATDDSASVFRFSEKFGADLNEVVPLFLRARELGLKPQGISFHVGSQSLDSGAWAGVLNRILPISEQLRELGLPIALINLGGGFPIQYEGLPDVPTLTEIAEKVFAQYERMSYTPELMVEPGRAMVANTGVLVTSVIARVERRGTVWLFLDAGVYNGLFETMAYQG